MQTFVSYVMTIAVVGGALVVSGTGASADPLTQLAQVTLDPPDHQPGATSRPARPVITTPPSKASSFPVPSVALDPPVDQTDELGLASSHSGVTSVERFQRDLTRTQPSVVEQTAPASPAPAAAPPPTAASPPPARPPAPAPPSPAAAIQLLPAPKVEPREQDNKGPDRGPREKDDRQEKWNSGKGYREYPDNGNRPAGTDGPYRIERADKVERADKIERPEKVEKIERVEKVDRVEKIEIVRPERVEKIEKIDKSGRSERVERIQKIEKPERGKK